MLKLGPNAGAMSTRLALIRRARLVRAQLSPPPASTPAAETGRAFGWHLDD